MRKSNTRNILLEIGTEELPVSHQKYVVESYINGPNLEFINHGKVAVYTTPRRIVFYIEDVGERQSDHTVKFFGPPRNIAFDSEGKPTSAAEGFARAQGVETGDLKIEKGESGEYVYVEKLVKGKDTLSYLQESLPRFITEIWFEKTMRWDGDKYRFSRPVRWILALYGNEVIKFKAFGLTSSNFTYGNRLVSNKKIRIKKADLKEYKRILKKAYVIVDQKERRKEIVRQLEEIYQSSKASAESVEERESIKSLLDEVAGLVEYPRAITGTFPKEYLALPPELVRICMTGHERFFPFGSRKGLEPKFISVVNNPCTSIRVKNTVRTGNESVLAARLADAKYFYEQDIKENIDSMMERLKTIIFQGGMGSLYDKVMRISEMSKFICKNLAGYEREIEKCARAGLLCKIDIGSNVVNEFPSLQGTMGRIYAEIFGEEKEVAQAIEDHYRPRFEIDMPGFAGAVVGIADRIDNICCFFAQGYKASGSEDPYGARRDAQGLIEVLSNVNELKNIPLKELVKKEMELIINKTTNKNAEDEIMAFLKQRIETFFRISNIEYDEANAVMEIALTKGIGTAVERAKVIKEFKRRSDFKRFIIAFKRVVNILEQAKIDLKVERQKLKETEGEFTQEVSEELLKEKEEKKLYEIYTGIKNEVRQEIEKNNFMKAMDILLSNLAMPIDDFFDHVLVMSGEQDLRKNRLALLSAIANLFFLIADFSKIVLHENITTKT